MLQFPVPWRLGLAPQEGPGPRDWQWGLMINAELSLKLLSPLLLVPVSQASLPLNPQSAPNDPLPWGDS